MPTLIERLNERARDPKRATDETQIAKPAVAGPPATEALIVAAETALGFRLPVLLRQIFQEVGNGGFGPGGGLRGLPTGTENMAASLVGQYESIRRENRKWPVGLIPLCDWGSGIESYADCSQADTPVIRLDPNMPRTDVATRVPVTRHYERAMSISKACWIENPSLEVWLEAWADGRPLFYLAYGGADVDEDGEEDEDGEDTEDDAV